MISTKGLAKSFRVHKKKPGLLGSVQSLFKRDWVEKLALKPFDLNVNEGEIVGLVGANGAGKTTLVKILAGIIHPTGGYASVLGFKPWERNNDYLRQMALIMGQKAQLWWDLPAADSFELLREIYEIDKKKHKRTMEYLVETLGVQDQLNIQIRRLSLGERMKMELIASLLHQPKIVFLDEPTIGLDLTAQIAIRKFIDQYRQEFKPAIILTSHYMEDIQHLCERIVIIKEGEKIYDGSLKEVVREHVKDRVITFTVDEKLNVAVADKNFTERGLVVPSKALLAGVEILSSEFPILKLKCPTSKVPAMIQSIMSEYSVLGIDISEEELAKVIESLIRKERKK